LDSSGELGYSWLGLSKKLTKFDKRVRKFDKIDKTLLVGEFFK
jgi:hypothetical protein